MVIFELTGVRCLQVVLSDNANNETRREDLMEEDIGHALGRAKCTHHTLMLLAKDCLSADNDVIFDDLGVSKDKDQKIREFGSSNVLNSLQYQLYKLFGHGWGSYVFGDGAVKFRTWMEEKHKGMLLDYIRKWGGLMIYIYIVMIVVMHMNMFVKCRQVDWHEQTCG